MPLGEDAFRAFVAVDVGPLPGVVSLLDGLRATGADLKVVDPENVHLTVKFIGTLAAARVPETLGAMREAVAGVAPFTLALEGVGTFGPRDAPRIVWVGIPGKSPLGDVAKRVDERLARLGVAEKDPRAFKPHVTLARSRSPRGGREVEAFARAHSRALAGEAHVADVRLMRSELSTSGPRYSVVERVPLEGA